MASIDQDSKQSVELGLPFFRVASLNYIEL